MWQKQAKPKMLLSIRCFTYLRLIRNFLLYFCCCVTSQNYLDTTSLKTNRPGVPVTLLTPKTCIPRSKPIWPLLVIMQCWVVPYPACRVKDEWITVYTKVELPSLRSVLTSTKTDLCHIRMSNYFNTLKH